MDQSQQITKLIEKALEQGWGHKDSPIFYVEDSLSACFTSSPISFSHAKEIMKREADSRLVVDLLSLPLSVNDLLFGDNLKFLESLLPETFISVVKLLVVDNEEDRIPCLYSEVFGGQDD